MSSLEVEEKYSSVPFRFRATLTLARRLPSGENPDRKRAFGDPAYREYVYVNEKIAVAGSCHPDPNTHDMATLVAYARLSHLTDAGWAIGSLVVSGYSDKDA